MKTILVVDDDSLIRDLVDTILKISGFETIVCGSGEEAILHIDAVDAVVTDFQMLGMNGVDLARVAKHRRSNLPVLIMTGKPDLIPNHHWADKVITKPFPSVNDIPLWLLEVLPEEVK
ncbi:MAG: response regulator [Candidatus Paceibacterota bacterium]|jgi:DNA-binding response OmpR family regulator